MVDSIVTRERRKVRELFEKANAIAMSGLPKPQGARHLGACNRLVVDQKMPGLSGLDLIAKLRDRRIAAPAILITGHPSMLRQRAEKADVRIVEKPLPGDVLLAKIRDVVGDRGG